MIEFDQNLNPVEPPRPSGPIQPPMSPPPAPQPSIQRPYNSGWYVLALILVIAIAITLLSFVGNRPASSSTQPEGLNVSADATVYATPDVAKVTIGVNKLASTVADVEKQVTDITQKIKDKLTALGIKDADIKTVDYSLYPEQTYRSTGVSQITGYRARHSLQITIRDLDKTNEVVSAATSAGANEVGQVIFTLENPDSKLTEARKEAMKKAKDKAKQMAEDGDFRLGRLISINEYNDSPIPFYDGMGGGTSSSVKEVAPTAEPGSYNVKVTVNLTYQIR